MHVGVLYAVKMALVTQCILRNSCVAMMRARAGDLERKQHVHQARIKWASLNAFKNLIAHRKMEISKAQQKSACMVRQAGPGSNPGAGVLVP